MYTTYHFNSASEVSADIPEAIKIAFKGKAIVITVTEENETATEVPDWQKELVLKEKEHLEQGKTELLNWEESKKQFKSKS